MYRIASIHAYLPPSQQFRDVASAELTSSGRRVHFLEDEDAVRSALPEMQALLCAMRVTADWSKAERLELLQVLGSGVEFLAEGGRFPKQLRVANARGIHGTEMRDHVLAMLLAFAREHPRLLRQQRERRFEQFPAGTVAGKSLCIVGLGEVGRSVAAGATALGMTVLGVRSQPERTPHVTEVVAPTQLVAMLSRSDYVAVCVPLTPSTRGLVGSAELSEMPRHAVLIDVSRGGVVESRRAASSARSWRAAWCCPRCLPRRALAWRQPLVATRRRHHLAPPRGLSRRIPRRAWPRGIPREPRAGRSRQASEDARRSPARLLNAGPWRGGRIGQLLRTRAARCPDLLLVATEISTPKSRRGVAHVLLELVL